MIFAVIGDIKSNFSGLQALLDNLRERGIQRVLQTGNVCGGVENSRECLALLRERSVVCVQGREDRALVSSRRKPRQNTARQNDDEIKSELGSSNVEYLHNLPRKRMFVEEGLRIVLCHGAINSAQHMLTRDTPMPRFRREREIASADIIVCGGAPDPFIYHVDQSMFVCPGAMGDEAGLVRYSLVDTEVTPWSALSISIDHVRDVKQDQEAAQ